MKKLKVIFATIILCLGMVTTMASCSDKDDEPATPAAKILAGTYDGDIKCSAMGRELTFEDITLTIVAVDDATVNVTISSFGEPPMQVSEIQVPGVKATGTDGKYSLAATEFSGTTDSGKAYSGTIQGTFENDELTIKFNLQYGAMPMPMICYFKTSKK